MSTIRIVRTRQTATTNPQRMARFRLVRRAARRALRSATRDLDPVGGGWGVTASGPTDPSGAPPVPGAEPSAPDGGPPSVGYGCLDRLGYLVLEGVSRTVICP